MDDFNSSDIEVSDHEDGGSRIGSRAIASIIENSIVDRVESKKAVESLEDSANDPSTEWHRKYWYELFKQFAQHTLQIDKRPK